MSQCRKKVDCSKRWYNERTVKSSLVQQMALFANLFLPNEMFYSPLLHEASSLFPPTPYSSFQEGLVHFVTPYKNGLLLFFMLWKCKLISELFVFLSFAGKLVLLLAISPFQSSESMR